MMNHWSFIFLLLIEFNVCTLSPGHLNVESPKNATPAPHYGKAGVVTNSETCTNVALEILNDDGSATDAAIAALLCEGITNPQSMGIGGGFLMTIYDSCTQKVQVLNAREIAPGEAEPGMFGRENAQDDGDIASGGLAVAVPGEIMGYWEAHQKYGKMGWYDLFRPAIDLATKGVSITKYTAEMIHKLRAEIMMSPTIKDMLTNPETGTLYQEGETMKRLNLADTLEMIAKHGPQVLYNGSLADDFLSDIREHGGIINSDDLKKYRAVWNRPIEHSIGDFIFFSAPTPGSGELLMYVIDVMANKLCNKDQWFWQHLIETWKFVFGIRAGFSGGKMGPTLANGKIDSAVVNKILEYIKDDCSSSDANDYLPKNVYRTAAEDHGTSHICVYAPNGDAVSVTSTINLSFGAMFVSESTGIILNNEMMDFSIQHHFNFKSSKANQISPYSYPMSSMSPTIVYDTKAEKVRLVFGASGGFKILTSASIVALEHLFMNMPLYDAIVSKRLHHQLKPMVVEYEEGFSEDVLQYLQRNGNVLQSLDGLNRHNSSCSMAMYSCVNAIAIVDNKIYPVGDPRRQAYGGGL